MGMQRRAFLGATVGALVTRAAGAQPARTGVVRLVLGFSAGGAADRVARVLAPELGRVAGRSVIVENLPGANSGRAIQRVAMSEPDGDTLLMATSAIAHPDHAIAMEALRPVLMASTTPMVLVVRGTLPAFGDLMGGHIDFMVMGASPSLVQQQAVRLLAVTTRQRSRLPALDRLPTIAETLGSDFDHSLWQAIYAPARVPATTLATLEARFRAILGLDAVRVALADHGSEPIAAGPDAANKAFRAEAARYAASPAQ
jgi:tripartite-type tricarboxylate transporter receptor subunit TctC